MDAYSKFAQVYDELMEDVPYEEISQIIDSKIKKYGVGNNIVLDLACGTGTLTKHLSDKGYEMIGADMSAEMLQIAQEKNPGVLFLNQPMEDFELYGTVGAIVCSLDSVNYLLDDESLYETFRLCNNYLEPDGLLIFDINTEYKFKNILADNIFTFDNDRIFYTWENNYCEEEKLCDFYLTFFVKGGRVSKTSGFVGNMLNICPLLNVSVEGKLIPRYKIRTKRKVIEAIVKKMEETADDRHDYSGKCYISNSACFEDARAVADLIEERFLKCRKKYRFTISVLPLVVIQALEQ